MLARVIDADHPIGYLCAEYGFDTHLPLYMGGLGILAGDTLKEAADQDYPILAVGLLYRGKMMVQQLDASGKQTDADWNFDPVSSGLEHVYLNDTPLFISVTLGTTTVWLRCWKKTFSDHVTLYLLDANTDQNPPELRNLTELLYVGDAEYQLKQQVLHGVGAVKLITALGITPAVYHFNEGRPIFAHWQLLLDLVKQHQIDAQAALQLLKKQAVYTNHTLIPAGNQSFPLHLIQPLAEPYAQEMGISTNQLMSLGSSGNPDSYSMTTASLNVTGKVNGVSSDHTRLSQRMWPDYDWVNVTNGVHRSTWQDAGIFNQRDNPSLLWHRHQELKKDLQEYVLQQTGFGYDEKRLVVTWARRIVGYKQLDKIIQDATKIMSVLSNSQRPIQLLVAGKAHPGGMIEKELISLMIQAFSQELADHALFIPNYRIELAQKLVAGSDVWLNTPMPGNEACGTSGMKAIANGVLNLTTIDGWTEEVSWEGVGWSLDQHTLVNDLCTKLETQVAPTFYQRDEQEMPQSWIAMMQKSIHLFEKYSATRMLQEYQTRLYANEV